MFLALTLCASLLAGSAGGQTAATCMAADARHDKAFWQTITKNNFKPPEGSSTSELAHELSESLGSPDPEIRDESAYSILATWIYRTHQLDTATLRSLTAEWLKNLSAVSDPAPDSVLRRSFSALILSVVVAHDNAEPYLEKQEFRAIWDSALVYLAAETDLRGFDSRLGWIHSAAHTADLLKFLARSRYVEKDDQAALLAAIGRKLTSVPVVFVYGEDERYARGVLSVIMRSDFDVQTFTQWAKDLRPAPPRHAMPSQQVLRSNQNVKNFLAKLDFLVLSQPDQSPNLKAAEEAVRASLNGTF